MTDSYCPTPADFDDQPVLESARVHLSPLKVEDIQALADAASDPKIWAGHPATDRWKPEVFKPYATFLLENGGTLVVRRCAGDTEVLGCSRYYSAPDHPDDISIGFTFLRASTWGGHMNRAMKTLMLDHAFAARDTVWLHIDPDNIRSQRATAKLGAVYVDTKRLILAPNAADYACYRLTIEEWRAAQAQHDGA
ncbi:MAG: GNAT family N-acetyltransferase [Pseudomonadota bacterium]